MSHYINLPAKLLVVALVATVTAKATLIPNLDLETLADESDTVVVGQVVALQQERRTVAGGENGTLMRAQLQIARVLKGQPGSQHITFHFFLPDAPVGYQGIPKRQFGVFFLRNSGAGYEVASPYYPFVVASAGTPRSGGSILDQIIAEVAYVLQSSGASSESRMAAVLTLQTARTAASTAALRAVAHDPDLRVQFFALAALMQRNDLSLLPEAQRILLHSPSTADPNWVNAIAYGIRDGVRDMRAIPLLEPLLHAASVEARRAAAHALRTTGGPSAIGPLTEALGDGDPLVSYDGVIGLAEITGTIGEWAPAYDTFLKDQNHYLRYWRSWAESRN